MTAVPPVQAGELMFFHGRLMRGHRDIPPGYDFDLYGEFVGYGFIEARMARLNQIPVLVPGSGRPFGVLYRVDNAEKFCVIDNFLDTEGRNLDRPKQVRKKVEITDGLGQPRDLSAWPYFLENETLPENAEQIWEWPLRSSDAGAGKFGEHYFLFGSKNTGPIKTDLGEALAFFKEVKRRRLYFHTVEGWEIGPDSSKQLNLSISKLGGLRGDDNFTALEQHHEVSEMILNNATQLERPTEFEIWISDESDFVHTSGIQ